MATLVRPLLPLLFFPLVFFVAIFFLPVTASSLSTVSISHGAYYTVICALIPSNNSRSYLNCTSSPGWVAVPVSLPGVPIQAVAGGAGFVCVHTLPPSTSSNASIRCWRFAGDGTVARRSKRVYSGPALEELAAGDTHLCGVAAGKTRRLECWQWRSFRVPPDLLNLSGIAVGGEFVCGLSPENNVRCLGPDSEVAAASPEGNYSAVAAGSRHACAISFQGRLRCWGPSGKSPAPSGEFQAVAAGGNRSCGLRLNGTAVCWSDDGGFGLPEALVGEQFVAVQGQGSLFCGVSASNYSLLCWKSQMSAVVLFDRVLPGACRTTPCPCSSLLDSGSLCGGSSGGAICQPCPPTPPIKEPHSPPPAVTSGRGGLSGANVAFLVVGTVGSTVGLAVAAYFLLRFYCLGKGCSRVHDSGRLETAAEEAAAPVGSTRLRQEAAGVEEFSFRVVADATGGFSSEHLVGSGAFGSVYRGTLPDGREVAIKRAEAYGVDEEKDAAFASEVAQLSRVNHKNLVRLLGFCEEGEERVLVYEFMSNGSLHRHLHGPDGNSAALAAWTRRMKVALDAARGVEYLHAYAVPPVIHRDIKSSNILLDESWTAKVADFGLSLLGPDEYDDDRTHLSARAAGTVGYIDPEYYRRQVLTSKSDVYSFGVLLLEILTGRKAIHRPGGCGDAGDHHPGPPRNVVDYALPCIVADEVHRVLDPRVPTPTPYEIEAVAYVGYLAADCVRPEGRRRPSMPEIVGGLERALAVCLAVPPPMSFSASSLSDDSA